MRIKHAAWLAALVVAAAPAVAHAAAPPPLDPQDWQLPDNMTWGDYHALPGPDYSDPSIQPSVKKWHVAIVLTDFPDKPFTLSQPVGGTPFGTPTAEAHDIPRDQVPAFMRDFLNTPQALNHFQTMNRYWMEDSHGKYGVQLDAYGPYQMPADSYQYFMTEFGGNANQAHCPNRATNPCNRDFRTDAKAAWQAQVGAATVASYDNVFYVSAGEDESSTWQEFGTMKWLTQDQVPDQFGPKQYGDLTQTNWAVTRYVPWTSWASAASIWPNAVTSGAKPLSSIEAESSGLGTYTHELTHNLNILDNYNNPYNNPTQRSATGPWDMMSRGSFGGPGGPHARYLVPPTTGGALGSQHNVRNKLKLGFIGAGQVLQLNRNGLAQSGLAVADVTAREVDPGSGLSGVQVNLDGASGDLTPACTVTATAPTCVTGKFDAYMAEVVQQLGSDSFDPGHGVLFSKIRARENSSCGTFSCFVWIVDSHPQDIGKVDFIGPDGTPNMMTMGDQRQLDDATFNAGLNSGSSYEYEDTANRLRFYVIDLHKDAQGVLHYTLGVQSLDGNGPQPRGVALKDEPGALQGSDASCTFDLTNTGQAVSTDPALHPQDANAYLTSDVYRLSASATGTGWSAGLQDALATAKFGETIKVPVYVTRAAGSSPNGTVTLTATSVSDPAKTATAVCGQSDGNAAGTVPATLALSTGTPASFGQFLPGQGREYTAGTTASVISTAGDAQLSVSDPDTAHPGHLVNGSFALPQALQAQAASPNGTGGAFASIGAATTQLLSYAGPVSNDLVALTFKQVIAVNDPLRTGSYGKTLTFTLSTTNP